MLRSILLFALAFLALNSPAQNWAWSKHTDLVHSRFSSARNLLTANANIYQYGCGGYLYYQDPATDTVGSYLQLFSMNGDAVSTKHWKQAFYVHQVVSGPSNNLLFAGSFFGHQVIDGIPISATDKDADAVVGSMDASGAIQWMHTFGGGKFDQALCILYDAKLSRILVGGAIADSLAFDHVYASTNSQSGIVASYATNGQLLGYKLYDPAPAQSLMNNAILEISEDKQGNIFMLADRDGRSWSGSGSGPEQGRYVVKTNASLDTLWTRFIIGPGCYYGEYCRALRVSASGDAYVTSFCSGKYGGDGELYRLSGATGAVTWSHSNPDGVYKDLVADSNTVYVVGNEGANGCPCPASTSGYYVVKMFDETNALIGETRLAGGGFISIVANKQDGIYVSGNFGADTLCIGPDKLLRSDGSTFLSHLSLEGCTVPVIKASANLRQYSQYDYLICPGRSTQLSAVAPSGTYTWSTGATGIQTTVSNKGQYLVANTQANGCVAYSLPVYIDYNDKAYTPGIYLITYDTVSDRNIVVGTGDYWEGDISAISLYTYHMGGNSMVYEKTGHSLTIASLKDTVSDPNSATVTYYVGNTDSCGNVSALSRAANSTFLSVLHDSVGHNILQWNTSTSPFVHVCNILRGTSRHDLKYITNIDPSSTSYFDLSPSTGAAYYQIEYSISSITTPEKTYYNTYSNIANAKGHNTLVAGLAPALLELYPNPSRNTFVVSYNRAVDDDLKLVVRNSLGEEVYSTTMKAKDKGYSQSVDLQTHPPGIYLVELIGTDSKISRKIVRE